MRVAVISLPGYEKKIGRLLGDSERMAMENHVARNPEMHPVVAGTGGVRKARWALEGSGKSGGIRVIYFYMNHRGRIYMLDAYPKSEQADLTAADKKTLKGLTSKIKKL